VKSIFKYPEGVTHTAERQRCAEIERDYGEIGRYRLLLEDLVFEHDGHVEIRFGYYRKGPKSERWGWASRATFCFPVEDTLELLAEACRQQPEWRRRIEAVLARSGTAGSPRSSDEAVEKP
jgi:hypothetical protein